MTIALILIGAIVLFMITINVIPKTYIVEKTTTINGSKENIKNHLIYFEKFRLWSPWSKLDPNQETTIENDGQEGAVMTWKGDKKKVGSGSQVIDKITDDRIDMTISFTSPMKMTNAVYYKISETAQGVQVTWGFEAHAKVAAGLFFNFEKQIGGQYEEGLASLKTLIEQN